MSPNVWHQTMVTGQESLGKDSKYRIINKFELNKSMIKKLDEHAEI